MNDLTFVYRTHQDHANHCVTFDVEYLGNRQRQRLGSKGPPIENGLWAIKWSRDRRRQVVTQIPLERNMSKTAGDAIQQQSLITRQSITVNVNNNRRVIGCKQKHAVSRGFHTVGSCLIWSIGLYGSIRYYTREIALWSSPLSLSRSLSFSSFYCLNCLYLTKILGDVEAIQMWFL